ncbi:hypothetical protein ACFVYC_00010 [Pseudarthrobacter sp. NPDC058329]|uniref:hypothetical protein n=1 Tax=Pseudarthrobacter sp. NPDC058329 TaxID=3346448 RepID=UPI0036D8DFF3
MTYSATTRQRFPRKTHRSSRRLVGILCVTAAAAWLLAVMLAPAIAAGQPIRALAISVHIIAMVLGFGAILLVDWHGFLWLIGKRQLAETIRLDGAASPLIWSGTALLLLSGAFLNPALGNPWTVVKLGAVLVLMLNGIMLIPLMRRLVVMPRSTTFASLPVGQRIHMLLCLGISQACWWAAIVIGFINAEL